MANRKGKSPLETTKRHPPPPAKTLRQSPRKNAAAAVRPGSGRASSPCKAGLRRVVTFPHWAEGSVAFVGLPAGGSWRRGAGRCGPLVRIVGGVRLWAVLVCLLRAFLVFLPRQGAARRNPRPLRATALSVPCEVSCLLFLASGFEGQPGAASTLPGGREAWEGVLAFPAGGCHLRGCDALARLYLVSSIRSFGSRMCRDPFKLSSHRREPSKDVRSFRPECFAFLNRN